MDFSMDFPMDSQWDDHGMTMAGGARFGNHLAKPRGADAPPLVCPWPWAAPAAPCAGGRLVNGCWEKKKRGKSKPKVRKVGGFLHVFPSTCLCFLEKEVSGFNLLLIYFWDNGMNGCCDKSVLGCSRKCRDSWLNTEDSMLGTLPQSCQTSHQHLPDSSRLPARGICSSNSYYLLLCFNAGFLLVISTCIRMIWYVWYVMNLIISWYDLIWDMIWDLIWDTIRWCAFGGFCIRTGSSLTVDLFPNAESCGSSTDAVCSVLEAQDTWTTPRKRLQLLWIPGI